MAGTNPPSGTTSGTTSGTVQDPETANDVAAYAKMEEIADQRSLLAATHQVAMDGYKLLSEGAEGMPT